MISRARRGGGRRHFVEPRSESEQTELVRAGDEASRFDSRYVGLHVLNRWLILLVFAGLGASGILPVHPLALTGTVAWIFMTNVAATWVWRRERRVQWYDRSYLFMDALSVTFGVIASANLDYPVWIAYVVVMTAAAAEMETRYAVACMVVCLAGYAFSAATVQLAGWYRVDLGVFLITAAAMYFVDFNAAIVFDGSRRLRAHIRRLAVTDPLTGLANRRRLSEFLAAPGRLPGPAAVAVLDVDDFKEYNDSLGHLAGDRLLVRLARDLEAVFFDAHTISRYGGDEFVVVFPCRNPGSAARRAAALAEGSPMRRVPVSIGLAVWPYDESTLDGTLAAADDCLREAKRKGKGRLVAFWERPLAAGGIG